MEAGELQARWEATLGSAAGWGTLSGGATYRPAQGEVVPGLDAAELPRVTLSGGGTLAGGGTLSGGGTLTGDAGAAPTPAGGPGYELLAEIGRGGMGVVYRARQTSLRREVAIKQVLPGADAASSAGKFLSEALVTGVLDHPNIVPVHELGRGEGGEVFLAMKLVGGRPWDRLLHPRDEAERLAARDYDLARHVEVLLAVGNAVAFAHTKGIVHRDLKPENVMVGDYGEVLVMDWGIAVDVRERPEDDARAPHRSTITAPAGTPAYMAPEMAEGRGEALGPATDVYLLGAILHELVTGRPPHRGETLLAILLAASASAPPRYASDVPAALQAICLRAMAPEPAARYPTVEAFAEDLRAYLRHRESLGISQTADRELAVLGAEAPTADKNARYARYAKVVARYEQALELWDGNAPAREGARRARLAYARVAREGGDLGLAAAQLAPLGGDPEAAALAAEVEAERQRRDAAERAARRLRAVVIAAVVVIVAGLGVGIFLVERERAAASLARDDALVARDDANRARADEAAQREAAEAARDEADQARLAEAEQREAAEAAHREVQRRLADLTIQQALSLRGRAPAEASQKLVAAEALLTEARAESALLTVARWDLIQHTAIELLQDAVPGSGHDRPAPGGLHALRGRRVVHVPSGRIRFELPAGEDEPEWRGGDLVLGETCYRLSAPLSAAAEETRGQPSEKAIPRWRGQYDELFSWDGSATLTCETMGMGDAIDFAWSRGDAYCSPPLVGFPTGAALSADGRRFFYSTGVGNPMSGERTGGTLGYAAIEREKPLFFFFDKRAFGATAISGDGTIGLTSRGTIAGEETQQTFEQVERVAYLLQPRGRLRLPGAAGMPRLSRDGSLVAVGRRDGVELYDVATGGSLLQLPRPQLPRDWDLQDLLFSQDLRALFAAYGHFVPNARSDRAPDFAGGAVIRWELASGEARELRRGTLYSDLEWLRAPRELLVAGEGTLVVVDAESGEELRALEPGGDFYEAVEVAPDGSELWAFGFLEYPFGMNSTKREGFSFRVDLASGEASRRYRPRSYSLTQADVHWERGQALAHGQSLELFQREEDESVALGLPGKDAVWLPGGLFLSGGVLGSADSGLTIATLAEGAGSPTRSADGWVVAFAVGADLEVCDFAAAKEHAVDLERIAALRAELREGPLRVELLAELGGRYAARGAWAFAEDCLRRAWTAGSRAEPLARARAAWRAGDWGAAAEALGVALEARAAPIPYLSLCLTRARRLAEGDEGR